MRNAVPSSASGSTLLWAIGVLVLLSVVGATISQMSPSSLQGKLEQEAGARAYYNANSGLNYIIGMQQSAQSSGTTFANFVNSMGNGTATTVSLSSTDSYTYKVETLNSANTTYQITSLIGTVKNSSGGAAYAYAVYGGGKGNSGAKTYTETTSTNPRVPQANFAGAMYNFAGTQFTGDTIFTDAEFNGGVTVDGSISYVGTGTDCLTLDGNRIGKLDGSSVICSNTCIILNNINYVYGTVVSQGDITIKRGTIYGNAKSGDDIFLAQWNGYIKKLSGSMGNAELIGYVDYPGNIEGKVTYVANKPDACKSYTLPDHLKITPASNLLNYSEKTFYGGPISDTTTYDFNKLSTNGGAKTCFDLSDSGTYINIFVADDLNFNSSIYIRSSKSENCYDDANKITTSNYTNKKFTDAAKRIYMDVNGKSTFGGDGHAWVGTLFSKGDITSQGSFVSVGALYSDGAINTSGGSYAYFVMSDYANKYW